VKELLHLDICSATQRDNKLIILLLETKCASNENKIITVYAIKMQRKTKTSPVNNKRKIKTFLSSIFFSLGLS
jgi:hypothetical protein